MTDHQTTNPKDDDMTGPIESRCARCLRPVPGDVLPTSWEAVTADDGEVLVICEGCVTGEEQQAMDEAIMALGDDPDAHDFTSEDDTLLGVVEPDDPTTDPATAAAERAARIARITAVLVATGADPEDLRFFAGQVWMQGWLAGWDERGAPRAGISRNPYDKEQSS
jgi:hypothetical protein